MLEFQAPTHRVGACKFVSLAIGRDVSAAIKKKYFLGGMAFILGLPVPDNAENVPYNTYDRLAPNLS